MTQETTLHEFEKQKLPSSLNILTILTIIGSIIGFIGGIWGYISAKKNYEETKKVMESGKLDEMPGFMRGMMTPEALEMQHKMMENKLPILLLTLVANALCLWGAMEMRKQKKQGYTFWLIGELLPVVTTVLFIGMAAFSGFGLLMWLIPVIFIILYTVNRKHLVY